MAVESDSRPRWCERNENGIRPCAPCAAAGTGRLAAPGMSSPLEELRQLEIELHRLETRRNAARLGELLHPNFVEVGRSGRRFTRDEILDEFTNIARYPDVVSRDFRVVEISDGVALLTYVSAHRLASGELQRHTLRSSLWVRDRSGWRMLFHQGTPADGRPPGAE